MKPISTPWGKRERGSVPRLGPIVTVVALGGLALIARPREAPSGAGRVGPMRPGPVVTIPGVLTWERRARSFDRCLVPPPSGTVDPGFVVPAPEVDPGMIAPASVVGLPVAPRNR
jgi:hypothetical protein